MLKILNNVSDKINKVCEVLAVTCVVVLVVIMSSQIFTRAFMGHAITWVDGTSRYMLIWSTFLGATIAAKEAGHIQLTFILDRLRGKARIIGDCIVSLLFMILAAAVVQAGILAVELVIPQKSDTLPISVAWIYAAIPVCEAIIFYHLFVDLLNKGKALFGHDTVIDGTEGGNS